MTITSAACGETALHRAAENNHATVCEMLLKYDASHKPAWPFRIIGIRVQVAQRDFRNHTPFAYAVEGGHVVVEVFLRGKWVSPKAKDGYENILFHEAVRTGQCDIVQEFLDYGAPVDLRDRDGTWRLARLLLENGASPTIKDSIENTPGGKSRDPQVTMLIRDYEDRAASAGGKRKKVVPPKAAVAAPPEYVA
ncbi:unnamed protein product [Penicillium glandicola]